MSAAKFTPGPWRVNFSRFSEVRADNGALIAKCSKLTGLVNLQANSRLIACSPDLFSIVERLAALHEGLSNGNSSAELEVCKLADQARAAIAKATGEQP